MNSQIWIPQMKWCGDTHTHTIANCYKKVTEWRRCENLPSLDRCDLRCRRRLPEAVYILPQKSHLLQTVPGIIISCSTVTVNCHTFPLDSDQVKQDIKKMFPLTWKRRTTHSEPLYQRFHSGRFLDSNTGHCCRSVPKERCPSCALLLEKMKITKK